MLARLLRPRSIAAVGGRAAAEVVRQCRRLGFAGAIWPVHPDRDRVEGLAVYRTLADLPAAPDAVFLGVNRHATESLLPGLRDAGGAVCFAAGFSETGDDGLQRRLVEAAGTLPFLGPNCHGFINYFDGAALWPDQHGGARVARGVAILTQSGNIGLNLTMQRRALPIGYLITLGNQAQIGLGPVIEAMLDDARVTAIGLHIEGIDDPRAFARAAGRARARGIPIVALKTGRTAAGAALTVSHTASLAGDDAAVDAFLRRVGVARVGTITALLETLRLLQIGGPLGGRDIVSLSCSGGEAALIADAAAERRVSFRPLDPGVKAAVAATLPDLVTVSNPFDYHTFHWGNAAALTATFTAVMRARYDLACLILDFPRADRCDDAGFAASAEALIAAAQATGGRAAVIATLPETMPEDWAGRLAAAGIAALSGIEDALAAIEAAADLGLPIMPLPDWPAAPAGAGHLVTEWPGKQLLAAAGVAIPNGRLVDGAAAAVTAAEAIGYPVVVKAVAVDLAHKTEAGAVRLDLRDGAAVAAAARDLLRHGDTLLVEAMIADAVAELIVGIRHADAFGPQLLIGSGGILVELVGDVRLLPMPAAPADIRAAIMSLKAGRLIAGHRGRTPGDLDAAVAAVLAIQAWAAPRIGTLCELDVNPLMVRPTGAVAADVLMRISS